MPLLCFDLIEGRSENQIKKILDVTHEVMVNAFNVPSAIAIKSSESMRHPE